ncbi:hypothetical protein D9619_008581 [Psilocybe cf. subviscida]|uniref:DUF6534 domain-containing protein n=1 Tax=Psilocybe cf. subviscida TaxID=2480587 RepID=A0A8H5BAF0_9AGAR|nr:hypothetical protein D9619_008581 [Psilocybe cf. subviscida]
MANLTPVLGMWFLCLWLQTLQVSKSLSVRLIWLYFHWYKNDSWGIKKMVLALLVAETFQSVVFFQLMYEYTIDGFGDFAGLLVVRWQNSIQLFATYLSAVLVQLYFGYCIYVLDRKNKILHGIILVLVLTELGAGLAQTIRLYVLGLRNISLIDTTKAITTVQSASALLCDIVITVSLIHKLGSRKTGVKSTNTLLDTLMINAVNRGMLTAVCALCNLVLLYPSFLLSQTLSISSSGLRLNSRQHIYSKAHRDKSTLNSLPMINMSTPPTLAADQDKSMRIVITKQSVTKGDNMSDYKTSTLTDGMV